MKYKKLINTLFRNRSALLLASGRNVLEKRFAQTIVIATVALAVSGVANLVEGDWATAFVIFLGLVVVGLSHALARNGQLDRAAVGMIWVLFAVATFSMHEIQGPFSSSMLAYPTLLLASSMMTSRRNVQMLLLAMIAASAMMIYVSVAGLHSYTMLQPGWIDLVYIGVLLLSFAAVSTLFGRDLYMALVSLQDEVERVKQSEQHLEYLAHHDQLTGLPNRRLFHDRLSQAIARFQRSAEYSALLLIDLDHFKNVNDSQGHAAGDALLLEVSARLNTLLRATDTASRFGGDEFVLLLEGLGKDKAQATARAHQVADKLLHALRQPIPVHGRVFVCTASLGVVLLGADTLDAESAIRHGDMAMYRAKGLGRDGMQFFDPAMQAAIDRRTRMEADLRDAITHRKITIHLQPQIDEDGRVIGAEALARWEHAELGFVPPDQFIALAEDMGLIGTLGQQVLESACTLLAGWSRSASGADWTLAVNVSVDQLRQSDFVAMVGATILRHGIRPAQLELEITESILINDPENVIASMAALRAIGVRLALDDFGTGYSSLSYVRRLPLDKLKIDQSFLRHVQTDSQDAAIVMTVISMARNLGLDLIAEGVETQGQRDFLAANGCSTFQGYLFGKPLPVDEFQARYLCY